MKYPNKEFYTIEWEGYSALFKFDDDLLFKLGPVTNEIAETIKNTLNGAHRMGYMMGAMESELKNNK